MLDGIEAGALGEHPAGEDAADLAIERDLVDLHERISLRFLRLRAGIADTRRHLQGAELYRLVDVDIESDDAPSDLVEAGELGDRIADPLGCRGWCRRNGCLAGGHRNPASGPDGRNGRQCDPRGSTQNAHERLPVVCARMIRTTKAIRRCRIGKQLNANCGDKRPAADQEPGVQAS